MNPSENKSHCTCEAFNPTQGHIIGKELTSYQVASDGSSFRMSFRCADGKDGSVTLPTECIQALIMTLPRMMNQALLAKHGDDTLRLVYPTEIVRVEGSSDPNIFIVTFVTPDGFAVSFSLSAEQLDVLRPQAS
jgi:hypothetical protein